MNKRCQFCGQPGDWCACGEPLRSTRAAARIAASGPPTKHSGKRETKAAISAFLAGSILTPPEITLIREHLRGAINRGPDEVSVPALQAVIDELRGGIDGLTSEQAIAKWLTRATEIFLELS